MNQNRNFDSIFVKDRNFDFDNRNDINTILLLLLFLLLLLMRTVPAREQAGHTERSTASDHPLYF